MIRVPSLIHAGEFQSLKIQDMTFVAYRNQDPPLKNEVFFEEHAVIFVLEGEKKFVSPTQTIHVRKGNIVFIRRGYYLMQETIDTNYRSLVFFFNEKLLKEFVGQHLELFENVPLNHENASALLVFEITESLNKFTESIFPYFHHETQYLNHFLRLKLQELLLHILEIDISGHFNSILFRLYKGEKVDLEYLMNSYYLKPLSLEELSRLSGRSLSAFKRDFQDNFKTSPALWIKNKRLEYAYLQLEKTNKNVSEISMEIGYESVSHFIKAFKEKFGKTPGGGDRK
ncbi:AraC family transcriptional regulator [Arcicella sp. LKC2W]|uniref:helix-turn-helix transcriptional regulator n=1 Tax=Arcicella sp. LKC2W TaxID=2984198 RepID=UPI002B1EE771|nr:AraC family transcriptional regulator [Arcicella sp. LKC2W]MEA5461229.1 AraC family transcriptional regulator [Arcicella sp. LKC2W]